VEAVPEGGEEATARRTSVARDGRKRKISRIMSSPREDRICVYLRETWSWRLQAKTEAAPAGLWRRLTAYVLTL
jgi:hypothetical protein